MTIELGGNITLTGFSNREFTELIVIKKIVGQYARRMSDTVPGFEGLRIAFEEEGHGSIAIHVHVRVNGHESIGDAHEHNIFVALDTALKRAEQVMRKHHEKEL